MDVYVHFNGPPNILNAAHIHYTNCVCLLFAAGNIISGLMKFVVFH